MKSETKTAAARPAPHVPAKRKAAVPTSRPPPPEEDRGEMKLTANQKTIAASVTLIAFAVFCIWWASRCRVVNYWIMFVPLVAICLPLTVLTAVKLVFLARCPGSIKHERMMLIVYGVVSIILLIWSILNISTAVEKVQTSWTWTHVDNQGRNRTDPVISYLVLNVEGCYGPLVEFSDPLGRMRYDWSQIQDVKERTFGLISNRQLKFEMSRELRVDDIWFCRLRCVTAYQPDIPCEAVTYKEGLNRVGEMVVTPDYRVYSDMMWISLILIMCMQVAIVVAFYIWNCNCRSEVLRNDAHLSWLLCGWPNPSDIIVQPPSPPPPPAAPATRPQPTPTAPADDQLDVAEDEPDDEEPPQVD